MRFARNLRPVLWMLLALCAGPGEAFPQAPLGAEAAGVQLTRDELQALLSELEESAQSSAYSAEFRTRSRMEAQAVRDRLETGDFQVGDQVLLEVEGEQALTNTFIVRPDRTLVLPDIGAIPMSGVLRSELEEHLIRELGRYIREPVVHARSLFRVTITGAVGQPGFYVVPAEALLTDALMQAGGPGARAKLNDIRIERNGAPVWQGEQLQQAIIEGRTLDQLSLQAGDRIVVPEQTFQWSLPFMMTTLSALAYTITRFIR